MRLTCFFTALCCAVLGSHAGTESASSERSTITFQGFEGTVADTWSILSGTEGIKQFTGTADTPFNQRIRTGSRSWQPGEEDHLSEISLELGSVDVSSYSDVMIELHMSATCTNFSAGSGMYPDDTVSFLTALNGNAYTSDLRVSGNEAYGDTITGVLWAMDATGTLDGTCGVYRAASPPDGGILADGYATIRLHIPDGTTTVKLKISVQQPYYGYYWNIDDITLSGEEGGAYDLPPRLSITPNSTSKNVAIGTTLTFDVLASEIPNDATDVITLSASGLPSGATFPTASGTETLSRTFSWAPETSGETVVSFTATDKDGSDQIDVTLRAYEPIAAGTYRAVIVGIANYEGTDNDLTYCDDDAQAIYDTLVTASNWAAANIELITDSDATKANILAAISAMGAAAEDGDVCLFFFSGHGSQITDSNGDEPDGLDETLCTYDLSNSDISDDEFSAALNALPTDNIIVLIDSCHSGGQLKAISSGRRKKFIFRPGITGRMTDGFMDDFHRRRTKDVNDLVSPYISTACDDNELSFEDDALQHGTYSYFLLESLAEENAATADTSGNGFIDGAESYSYLYQRVLDYEFREYAENTMYPQEYDGWAPRPANILTWNPMPTGPQQIDDIISVRADDSISISISSVAEAGYRLEYTSSLTTNPIAWTLLETAAGNGGTISFKDTNSSEDCRFYRVIAP